jgi:hypothetical protein
VNMMRKLWFFNTFYRSVSFGIFGFFDFFDLRYKIDDVRF